MKKLIVGIPIILAACGVSPLQPDIPEISSAILVTEGEGAAGIWPINSELQGCKLTTWGETKGLIFKYTGRHCDVTTWKHINGGKKEKSDG